MTQAAPIPFTALEEVHYKEPLQEVELPVITQPKVESLEPISPLHELATIDNLLITRRVRVKGALLFRGNKYKFVVRTAERTIYSVEEENSWWVGYVCYGLRPMQLHVRNNAGEEVMRIDRPYAFTTRMFPCQLQTLQVYSPADTRIGSIEQQWSVIKPEYIVVKDDGEQMFRIRGPGLTVSCFNDVQFEITRLDGTPVGSTSKKWPGLIHALFFSPFVDRFDIDFENNLNEQEKALLLAAAILMDYMYYDDM